jgi:hypothetical protein
VPLATIAGQSAEPGEAAGFGLLDADDARDLVAAAARHPATRWCLTALHPDGTAAAHACAPGRHLLTPALANLITLANLTTTCEDTAVPGSRAGPAPPARIE